MNETHHSPLLQIFSVLLTLALLNIGSGGPLFAADAQRARRVRERNIQILKNLGVKASLTADEIKTRRVAAREKIQQSRRSYIDQQRLAQAENTREGLAIKHAHLAKRMAGLNKRVFEMNALIADLRDGRKMSVPLASAKLDLYRDTLVQMHRSLTDPAIRALSLGDGVDPVFREGVAERLQGIIAAMAPLPDDPTLATRGQIDQVVQRVNGLAEDYEADHRRQLGKEDTPATALPYDALRGDIIRPNPKPPGMKAAAERRDPRGTDALFALFGDEALLPPGGNYKIQAPPTTTDLDPTPDVRLSPEIQQLATQFNNDPIDIFNYVVNGFDYQPYHGSRDGSAGALSHGYGNDADLASLLIALYRTAGIPARYEYGTAEMQPEQLLLWLGVDNIDSATTILAAEGIPLVSVYSGSELQYIKVERVWVRAYVPYTNYRGDVSGLGAGGESQWVTLDPAWKSHTLENRVDLRDAVDFDVPTYIERSPDVSPMAHLSDAINAYLIEEGLTCPNLADAAHVSEMLPRQYDLLPTTLPYTLNSEPVSASALPSSLRHSLQVGLYDRYGYPTLSYTMTLPDLFGERLALTFPSSDATLDSSLTGMTIPTLSINDVSVATGSGASAGTDTYFRLQLNRPGYTPFYQDHEPQAGGSYVFNLEFGSINPKRIEALQSEINSLEDTGATQGSIDRRIAQLAGLKWSQLLYNDDALLFGMAGHYHSAMYESMTGASVYTNYFWGLPNGAVEDGYFIDALGLHFASDRYDSFDQARVAQLIEDAGWTGSYWEHAMWGSVLNAKALSTTNILQISRSQGQNVYFLDSWDSYQAVKSELDHISEVTSDIESNLRDGGEVIIHQRTLNYQGRSMSGYLLKDPITGSGQYLIYDEIGGGQTTLNSIYGILIGLTQCVIAIFSDLNASSGNLILNYEDMKSSLQGPQIAITRTYNSTDEELTDFGRSWSWSFGDRLDLSDETGAVTYISPTGERRVFTADGSGGYDHTSRWYGKLTTEGSGYALVEPIHDHTYRFDSAGALLSREDTSGNTVTVNHNGSGEVTSLSDTNGRDLYTFIYTDGKITEVTDIEGRTTYYTFDGDNLTSYTTTAGDTWTYTYFTDGLLGEVRGPDGKSVHYAFDSANRLVQFSDDSGRTGYLSYDDINNRSSITSLDGATKIYRFDDTGQCLGITDATGNATGQTYDSEGNIDSYTDARGQTSTYEYNENGDITKGTASDGAVIEVTYDSEGHQTSVTSGGEGSTWDYAADGSLTVNNASGGSNTFTYDDRGQISSISREDGTQITVQTDTNTGKINGFDRISPTGETSSTQMQLDELGRVTSFSQGNGDLMGIGWDDGDHMASMTNSKGEAIGLSWDERGNLAAVTDPEGRTQTFTYDYALVASTTESDGRTTSWTYDSLGRTIGETNPHGKTKHFTWDLAGRLVGQTDYRGNKTELGYCADLIDMPCDVIDPYGNLIQREFDSNGRVTSETNALGTIAFEWNDDNQLMSLTNRAGGVVSYTYDDNRRLTQVENELGETTDYTYDSRGRLTTLMDAESHQTTFTYNTLGDLLSVEDANNKTTSFGYGFANQRSAITWPDGTSMARTFNVRGQIETETYRAYGGAITLVKTFTYDINGNLARITTGDTDIEFQREDSRGRFSAVIDHLLGEEVQITWDDTTGSQATQIRPDGTQKFTYDPYGNLATLTTPEGELFRYIWDEFNRISEVHYPNQTIENRTYDEWSRLSARYYTNRSGEIIAGAGFTYDALDRVVTRVDEDGGATTYTYDAASQLTGIDGPFESRTYEYDGVGNRVKTFSEGVLTQSCTFNEANQLTGCEGDGNTITYIYDARGNVISEVDGSYELLFTYDGANQMVESTGPSGTTTFTYDGLGRLYSETKAGKTRTFLYDATQMIAEYEDGVLSKSYVRAPGLDQLLAFRDHSAGTDGYFHQDGLLNVVALSNENGTIVKTYRYSPFGEVLEQTGSTANRMLFAGRPYDGELKRYHVRARMMDPATGRFMQKDPYNLSTVDTQRTGLAAVITANSGATRDHMLMDPLGRNGYSFARNAPLNHWDPSGENQLLFRLAVASGLAIGTAASGISLWPLIYANYKVGNAYVDLIKVDSLQVYFEKIASASWDSLYLSVWSISLGYILDHMGEELISTSSAATFNIQNCGGSAEALIGAVEGKLTAWSALGKIPLGPVLWIIMAYMSYFLMLNYMMIWLFQMPGSTVNVPIQCNCD